MTDRYQEASQIPEELVSRLEFECPSDGCHTTISLAQLQNIRCPGCGTPLTVRIIDDVVIPVIRRGGVDNLVSVTRIPELPSETRDRFVKEHDLNEEQASKLTSKKEVADFYEELIENASAKTAASFTADTLLGELHYRDMVINDVDLGDVKDLVSELDDGKITDKSVVSVVREALDTGTSIDEIYSNRDISKTEEDQLEQVIDKIIESEESAVSDYIDGETKALNYLIGQVMSETKGKADAGQAREMIVDQIKQRD